MVRKFICALLSFGMLYACTAEEGLLDAGTQGETETPSGADSGGKAQEGGNQEGGNQAEGVQEEDSPQENPDEGGSGDGPQEDEAPEDGEEGGTPLRSVFLDVFLEGLYHNSYLVSGQSLMYKCHVRNKYPLVDGETREQVDRELERVRSAGITWSSSDPSVATVDVNGLVTAVAPGTVTITAAAAGYSGTVGLEVLAPVSAILFDRPPVSSGYPEPDMTSEAEEVTIMQGDSGALPLYFVLPRDGGRCALPSLLTWSSSNPTVATVRDGIVTAVSPGRAQITVRSGSLSDVCDVHVLPAAAAGEAVDLGLSVKWASCNLGASSPVEAGDYYAWGEVETHCVVDDKKQITWKAGDASRYDWSTYKWSAGDWKVTKYCSVADFWGGEGTPDGKDVLDLGDDAAHAVLGGNWRMPTEGEWKALWENCTVEWKKMIYGKYKTVHGILATSKTNGNAIFLPARGFLDPDTGFAQLRAMGQDDDGYGSTAGSMRGISGLSNNRSSLADVSYGYTEWYVARHAGPFQFGYWTSNCYTGTSSIRKPCSFAIKNTYYCGKFSLRVEDMCCMVGLRSNGYPIRPVLTKD